MIKRILLPALLLAAANTLAANANDLATEMRELDTALFDSFNRCADSDQLARHEALFAEDVEFYHDNGGVTWDRASMIENTRKNACGNYRRKLLEQTFRAYPINNFGAITQGVHVFCENATGRCEGMADFVMVWKKTDDGEWKITRALSYGHRPFDSAAANESAAAGD
ncbi:nuclear transport factor 2 family protein [Microbulbifer yueqingensis]|uniref:DUF4440 domain-containing protein n=1 Tax=Microbulbifer yueqingensis TaxID=658219 RepID=A0A1G9DF44_9GAMM|nr:nuclear transport factor 2 family protein [Microbulbifer yueqingensis]SDK62414.1 protein of unknown function [Microbulbifer yueqingensis]